jgi:hypothetical protein
MRRIDCRIQKAAADDDLEPGTCMGWQRLQGFDGGPVSLRSLDRQSTSIGATGEGKEPVAVLDLT